MHLALSSWTFHDALYTGALALPDIPGRARALGFDAVELQDLFLWPRGNRLVHVLSRLLRPLFPAPPPRDYSPLALNRLRAAFEQSGVRLAAWDLDTDFFTGSRERNLRYARLGLRTAHRLGAPTLRLTVGGAAGAGPRIAPQVIADLRGLADEAAALGMTLALENHNDRLADPAALVEFVRGVNHPRLGVCLDFGNFKRGQEMAGVQLLAPLAVHAHAKCWEFDTAGEETRLDYRVTLAALKSAGFSAAIAIEYEGGGDPNDNALRARALLERYW